MKTSDEGIRLTQYFEKSHLLSYPDPKSDLAAYCRSPPHRRIKKQGLDLFANTSTEYIYQAVCEMMLIQHSHYHTLGSQNALAWMRLIASQQ